jgi:FdhD protein
MAAADNESPATAPGRGPGENGPDDAIALRPVRKVTADGVAETQDALAVERWLRLILNGREIAALMASPGYEDELGAGFALTQGFVKHRGELLSVSLRRDDDGRPAVRIVVPIELSLALADRASAQASCGGVVHADDELPVIEGEGPVVAAEGLRGMARAMTAGQTIYRRTGGTHGAGLFTVSGELVVLREDVGRHNAADKAVGHCLLAGIDLKDKALVVTGRVSRDIAAKAVRAGVPILASMSAPTDAGIEVAERGGLTVIGFLRGRRMNICSHPCRIDLGA